MTQDQYGQTRGPGYVVRDDAVPDDENEDRHRESKPMTRFQKVASALRGGPERDEQDQAAQAADPQAPEAGPPWVTQQDEAAMAKQPDLPAGSAARRLLGRARCVRCRQGRGGRRHHPDVPVPATGTDPLRPPGPGDRAEPGPDAADHPATQPDMFGTTTHAGNGATSAPYPEDQVGEAANGAPVAGASAGGAPVGGVPASGVPASGVPASGVPAAGVPAGGAPAGGVPAGDIPAGEVTGTTGRHAAGTESRPGEAAGTLGDFSDLTYGNLIPDATVYLEQWQQVQFKFVDDPHASVTEAADIVAQVTAKLEAAIQERQRAIEERQRAIAEQQRSLRGRWGEGTNADTEGAARDTADVPHLSRPAHRLPGWLNQARLADAGRTE